MPHLLLFVACEEVIKDEMGGGVSLINIMHGLEVRDPLPQDVPSNIATPLKWAMVAIWQRQAGDEDKTFAQRTQIIQPGGLVLGESEIRFIIPSLTHFNAVRGGAFPIARAGTHLLRLSLRDVSTNGRWKKIAEYPMEVTHSGG